MPSQAAPKRARRSSGSSPVRSRPCTTADQYASRSATPPGARTAIPTTAIAVFSTTAPLQHPVRPAVAVLGPAGLDVQQVLAELHREPARLAVADRRLELVALEPDDRADHGCGPGRERLGDRPVGQALVQLVQADRPLLGIEPVLAGQCQHAVTGHA